MFLHLSFSLTAWEGLEISHLPPICSCPEIKTPSGSEDVFVRVLKCKVLKPTSVNFIRDGIIERILVPHRIHKRAGEQAQKHPNQEKPRPLRTSHMTKGWIVWNVNYISITLFFFLNTQNVVCGLATWATSAGTAESFSSFPPDQLSENLHFNKILRSSVCILKFEKDSYRPRKVDFCRTLWTSSIFSTLLCGEFPTLSTASKRWNSETGLPSLPCNLGIHLGSLGSFD